MIFFKKFILLIFISGVSLQLFSKDDGTHATKNLTQSIPMLGYSFVSQSDAYLSPLEYTGFNVHYQNEWHLPYFANMEQMTQLVKFKLNAGRSINSAFSNLMYHATADVAWGAHYHYVLLPDFNWLVGGTCNLAVTGKYVGRNVNNPGSVDCSMNLNFSTGLQYNFRLFKQQFRVRYMMQTPLLGCMFVPELGASYYEMFDLFHLKNAFHFSSIHNMNAINENLFLDMRFKRSSWRIGVDRSFASWSANQLRFKRHELVFLLGTVLDVGYWGGTNGRGIAEIPAFW